ncbi:anti-sigma factor [Ramlibacter solisilvae]|uniref:Transmembrane anti-sigma factor n=1 Tax=Ramlibacter tataouinensis TaxID=94132 RepID=A0A127JYM5_9BURK|nr:anti-sigma factor [Ramlibacter tataouinensis]AMO24995.1 transmembrane anti-sigma factor [Ramlibacter tataouinensis]
MTIPEDELHALVDGRLPPEAAAALQARVDADPEAAATVAVWRRQREALRQMHRGLLEEPLPAGLAAAAQQTAELHRQGGQWWRWGGMAASVALAFALGWLAHGQWPGSASTLASNGTAGGFARQAAVAHVVYMPEVRHPVEVTAAQQDHLVQWLSKRLGRPLKVPQLGAQGYELVGGRLLPGEEGARAQFMFQNASGERVTLYIGAVKDAGTAASNKETAFRFTDQGPVPGFYWVDQGFGYALAGKLPRQVLLELATAVHQQL